MKRALILAAILAPVAAHAEPLKEPVVGPALVCFKYSSFRLADGERITEFDGGPEAMLVLVDGPYGAYRIGESEILAEPAGRQLVSDRDGTRVYRAGSASYEIAGVTSFSDGDDRFILLLEGEAIKGSVRDARIYRRLTVGSPATLPCEMRFTYGW